MCSRWFLLLLLFVPVLVLAQAGSLQTDGALVLPDPLQRQRSLAHGLVSWCKVIAPLEGSPRWYDLVGANHLSLTNMTAGSGWQATTRPGGLGELRLDGTNDYLTVPQSATLNLAQGTLAVWARRSGVQTDDANIVALGTGGSTGYFQLLWQGTSDTLRVHFADTVGTYYWKFATTGTYGIGPWWFLTLTVGPNGNAFYVNGLAAAVSYTNGAATSTTFFSTVYSTGGTLDVGRFNDAGFPGYLPGAVDDLMLWNRVLSASDVLDLYRQQSQGMPELLARLAPPLSAFYSPAGFLPFLAQ